MTSSRSAVERARQWPATWPKGWARGVATVAGILATAFAGLVIEDVFPNESGEPQVDLLHSTWLRVLLLALMGLLFYWVFWSGIWRDRTKGTLIYALFLSSGHIDRHSESAASSGRDRPVFRTLLRRCRIPTGLSVDVTDQIEEFADRLTEMIQEDDPTTRTTLAPNMLLPTALAMGWRLTPPQDFNFFEIDTRVGFSMDELKRAWAEPAATTSAVQDSLAQPFGSGPAGQGTIWLDIYLSNKQYLRQQEIGTGFPRPSERRTIGVPAPGDPVRFEIVRCGESGPGAIDPAGMAVLIARAVQQEVVKKRTVILTGRMPKSVSVAVGWLLWHYCQGPPREFWPYFVPLVWSDPDQEYRYLRVGFEQPFAEELGIGS